jgi:hypothetical protein
MEPTDGLCSSGHALDKESERYQRFECVAWVIARVYFKRSAEDFDAQ